MSRFPPETIAEAVAHLQRRDPVLKQVIQTVGPFRLRRRTNRFEALLQSIVSQQISTAAARSIWSRLVDTTDSEAITPDALARLSDAELRAAGLSPQKLRYVRDLTDRVTSGEIRLVSLHCRSDAEVIAELTSVKGIGVWTAQMFLMFSLGRLDVLPHGDLGIQSAIRRLYGLPDFPDRETCYKHAGPWRPYATVACWYLWRSLESSAEPKSR